MIILYKNPPKNYFQNLKKQLESAGFFNPLKTHEQQITPSKFLKCNKKGVCEERGGNAKQSSFSASAKNGTSEAISDVRV
jgi:hypothetical protein